MSELTLQSFGYLFGPPVDADTVIGARGLPNPYYVEALKHKTGLDPAVRDYVFSTPAAERYCQTVLELLRQRIAFHAAYDSPLKQPLHVAVGCSGGKHRSVSLVIRLAEALQSENLAVRVLHRDLDKTLEHSAGAVVCTRQGGELRYLIVQSRLGHHGFPKGHVEPGEREPDTALREIREETGLAAALVPGFRSVEVYPLPQKPGTWKQVVCYLAEYRDQRILPQPEELLGAQLLTFEEAMAVLEHENTRRVLKEANAFLNK